MQIAESSLTTSVIMAGWLGSIARANRARLFSSPRIRSRPYYTTTHRHPPHNTQPHTHTHTHTHTCTHTHTQTHTYTHTHTHTLTHTHTHKSVLDEGHL